ncbi:DUF6233 domain-containing protein [Streptomyces zhihengii]|uniref:DUF6233 domain-containing protein n=1 Tax=Streptomyces zhihengii TaxID=1818004 RepID=UPI0036BBE57F
MSAAAASRPRLRCRTGWPRPNRADRPRLYVHVGECHMADNRVHAVMCDVAARASADGVEACSYCGADAALDIT